MKGQSVLVEFVDRQQFDGRDAQRLQVGNLFGKTGEGSRMGDQ